MYAKFSNIDSFNTWHTQVCLNLGLPNNEGTLRYTEPVAKAGTDEVIAGINELINSSALTLITNFEAEAWMEQSTPSV